MGATRAAADRSGAHSGRRRILLFSALGLLVITAAVAWVGVRGLLAKDHLEAAVPLATELQSQIVSGEGDVSTAVERLESHASSAARLTSDPVWRAFEALPAVGPNLTAVRELADIVDHVSAEAIVPLVNVAGAVDVADFKPVDGAINLQPLVDAQPGIGAARAALVTATDRVRGIETSATLPVVRAAAERLEMAVADASVSATAVDRTVRLVPGMLGADGPRNYVLLFQNPAEVRAGGGNPGAVALIHTDNGRIDLVQQASTADFPFYETPVLELPLETRSLYGDITGQYMQDVSLTPQFPLTAQLAREMWKREFGVEADGVLSVDPVALGYLLAATGPITLPTGDVLTSENAVQLLLVDAYARYENPADQDAFFAAAAASVFSAVSTGNFDPGALVGALTKAGEERRILLWNARENEQAVLAGTTLTGELPVSDNDTTRFGVYLNDATGAKMDTYLDVQLAVGQNSCRNDLRSGYRVGVTLTNTAPADAATSLSEYVTGGGDNGVAAGNIKTLVSVYGAPGMQNSGMIRDSLEVPYLPTTDATHPVSLIAVELAPGESTVLNFDWLGADAFDGRIVTEKTPLVRYSETKKLEFPCESPLE